MTEPKPLARLSPPSAPASTVARLTRKQKAAVIVRFLLSEGADLPLSELPEPLQAELTAQMGAMRHIDRDTLGEVVSEFAAELEGMGLTFPHGVSGALSALDGRISPRTAARLRKEAGVRQTGDPWDQVRDAPVEHLLPMLTGESTEVAAVLLSKLDVARAADLLGRLPGEDARRITYAMSRTGKVTPDAVDRIGLSLAAQLADIPESAFGTAPVKRLGEILNLSASETRNALLEGLNSTDSDFAAELRRTIFTFAHIPARLGARDVPRVLREVDQGDLVTALATAQTGEDAPAAAFLLDSLSNRMAEALREQIAEAPPPTETEGEAAMTRIVAVIRKLEDAGDITLATPGRDTGG
ncbi:flagellar motor switch protein FliG [Roseovarius sp. TE539]|uniref:flagellar motor switch protein FliG n=1 Tax=Roseovarius sp. TE539 TaxID=2249812 RepID=UPI000DDE0ABF|nr:FliG C-terminal domain-containing protein [Roseovarius sp. TE539]RBI67879.1 flagellar motor switch protein FliG [Roseovarius sp. TE539]